jgi:hypothetical protein
MRPNPRCWTRSLAGGNATRTSRRWATKATPLGWSSRCAAVGGAGGGRLEEASVLCAVCGGGEGRWDGRGGLSRVCCACV